MLSRPLQLLLGCTVAVTAYFYWQEQSATPDLESTKPPQKTIQKMTIDVASPIPASATGIGKLDRIDPMVAAPIFANAQIINLFPKQSWLPPPPPPPPPAKLQPPTPTPVPVAPALPFLVTATWTEKNTLYVVVEAQDQSFVLCTKCDTVGRIQPGDSVMGVYRLDKLSPDMLMFTYLPLNQQQSLSTGGTP